MGHGLLLFRQPIARLQCRRGFILACPRQQRLAVRDVVARFRAGRRREPAPQLVQLQFELPDAQLGRRQYRKRFAPLPALAQHFGDRPAAAEFFGEELAPRPRRTRRDAGLGLAPGPLRRDSHQRRAVDGAGGGDEIGLVQLGRARGGRFRRVMFHAAAGIRRGGWWPRDLGDPAIHALYISPQRITVSI